MQNVTSQFSLPSFWLKKDDIGRGKYSVARWDLVDKSVLWAIDDKACERH